MKKKKTFAGFEIRMEVLWMENSQQLSIKITAFVSSLRNAFIFKSDRAERWTNT